VVHETFGDFTRWNSQVQALETAGKVTRTFRRLDQPRQWAVVEALLTEAAEHGPGGLNVKRVAGRAGVAVGSLYQYFPRRSEMLDVAARLAAHALVESLDGYSAQLAQLPLREALMAYLIGGVEWSRQFAGPLTVFARAAYEGNPRFADDLVGPVASSMLAVVTAIVTAAQARGDLRPGVDLDATARLTNTLLIAVADAVLLPHLNRYYLLLSSESPAGGLRPPEQVTAVLQQTVDFVISAVGVVDDATR
jgi:AcrR family transcriptional regulator